MKKLFLLPVCWFIMTCAPANDGVFYAAGNTLVPLEETSIELKKEVLILDRQHGCKPEYTLNVTVFFEFYNPDNTIEKLVGFVTPPAGGVIPKEETKHPKISNFTVMVNDKVLKYNVKRMDSTNFNPPIKKVNGHDFIYYFKASFKHGINTIKHTYSYSGSRVADSRAPGPHYRYRLTTGKTWANKQINHFELYINMGINSYFSVPKRFIDNKSAEWKILGIGKIEHPAKTSYNYRKVKMLSGFLYLSAKDFKPEYDLSITSYNPIPEVINIGGYKDTRSVINEFDLKKINNEELRILRNTLYALHGYVFKSKELQEYFSTFDWYLQNPGITEKNIKFCQWEKELLKKIIKEEKRR